MGVVYKISFNNCDEFYIGSTVNIYNRKKKHKYCCYNEKAKDYNYKLYKFIREHNYEWEDVIFEILEQHETVLDKLQLRKREQYFMDKLKPTLNKLNAYQTAEQQKATKILIDKRYQTENREKISEKKKIYNDKKENQERTKKYREENKEKIKEVQKIYKDKHKEEAAEYAKKYREENQDKLKYRNEKFNCECGGKYVYSSKSTHLKSTKHQDYLANSNK